MEVERPRKRRRISSQRETNSDASSTESEAGSGTVFEQDAGKPKNARLTSLDRAVTPPLGMLPLARMISPSAETMINRPGQAPQEQGQISHPAEEHITTKDATRVISSPISLTRIRDLPPEANVDTVSLHDILGDPLIKEAWIFDYLHDVSFTMSHFDPDVRDSVQVKIVHGSWKREDPHRIAVDEAARQYKNVQVIIAHMPEMFGTHHSKAIFLIRHDDLAQVVIHTANMIQQDWANLTQAVWRSPLLPVLGEGEPLQFGGPIGGGQRFKVDLINYLRAYEGRTKPLVEQLLKYDFSTIRAALIASVPCTQSIESMKPEKTRFGWSGLQHILKNVPSASSSNDQVPQLVVQISSVGHLGAKDKWFEPFLKALAVTSESSSMASKLSFTNGTAKPKSARKPDYHVIFPTADEVRRSLDAYASGASIHMKLANKAMQTQLAYMRPMLRHWAGDVEGALSIVSLFDESKTQQALRRRAAPHIKTYVRFSDTSMERIDWAMVTSANLSKQAWGEAAKEGKDGREVKIASYELGVVLWPALFDDDFGAPRSDGIKPKTAMVPVFGKDEPSIRPANEDDDAEGSVVGFRMPYDLPLVPYGKNELPWCATADHSEPDWKGVIWQGYSRRA